MKTKQNSVPQPPQKEHQAHSVPKSAENHRKEQVDIGPECTATIASEGDVEIVPKPG